MSEHLVKMIEAAHAGGAIIRSYFGTVVDTTEKSSATDLRTKADLESEAAILEILERAFPEYNILSEERGVTDHGSEWRFIIDPLDGTNNFTLGIPSFCVGIGLMKNGRTECAVIYHPILDQTYTAERGQGSWCGEKRLQVNNEVRMSHATVAYATSYGGGPDWMKHRNRILHLDDQGFIKRDLQHWCSLIDFCLLASGKIEAMILNDIQVYDFIPGKLIALEAGAKITDFSGGQDVLDEHPQFLVSNGTELHDSLLQIVRSE